MIYRNVAVIGCDGFIGRALTEQLSKIAGIRLVLFGRHKESRTKTALPYHQFDLSNLSALEAPFKEIDLVYYLISETIPATSWENPLLEIEKNLVPFLKFMEWAATQNIKKVAFISSAGTVYGPSDKMVDESSDKQPFSPYGITKLSMEYYLNYFEKKHGIRHDIFRVSNVYGKGQNTSKGLGIINTFLEKIIQEKKITIFGDGKNIRNYIYIKDVADLLCLSLNTDSSGIYNLSSDNTLSINELVEMLKEVVPEQFSVQYTATRQSDNSAIVLDNARIKRAVPDHRFVAIKEGIKETYHSLKEILSSKNVNN